MENTFTTKLTGKYVSVYGLESVLNIKKELITDISATATIKWTDDIDYRRDGIYGISALVNFAYFEIEYSYYQNQDDEENDKPTQGTLEVISTKDYDVDSDDFKLNASGQLIISEAEINLFTKTIKIS